MSNKTFMMIKPDAVERGLTGKILSDIIDTGFESVALKLTKLSLEDAKSFYFVHNERPFFKDLTEYMSRSSIVAAVIKKENAVSEFRKLIGDTDPLEADEGTLRKKYGISIDKNSVHGSDSLENAKLELDFFFKD